MRVHTGELLPSSASRRSDSTLAVQSDTSMANVQTFLLEM